MTAPPPSGLLRRHRIAAVISLCGILLLVTMGIIARLFLSSAASRAAVKDFIVTLNQRRTLAQAAIAASRVTDPVGAVDIEKPGEIERRLELLKKASAAVRETLEQGDRWPAELEDRLRSAGAMSFEINRWKKRFREQYDWEKSRPVYAARQHVVDVQIAMLKFLREHRDGWGVPGDRQGVYFYSREQRREFDSLLQEYANAVLAEQEAVR